MNRVYVHSALQNAAESGFAAFSMVFLVKQGMSVPVVLLVMATMLVLRLIMRKTVLPVALRFGLRAVIIIGLATDALSYLFLSQVTSIDGWLMAYLFFAAMGSTYYFTAMHALTARLGDAEHRGKQVSAREAINTMVGIVSPIVGGTLLIWSGPLAAFSCAALLLMLSITPLLKVDDVPIERGVTNDPAPQKFGHNVFITDGVLFTTHNMVSFMAMFAVLGESIAAFAGALVVANVAGAAMGLAAGRLIDLGHGLRALQVTYGLLAIILMVKFYFYSNPWLAVMISAISAAHWPMFYSAYMTPVYNSAKTTRCTLRYHVVCEGGWDMGAIVSLFIAAALLWTGWSYFLPIAMGVLAVAAGYILTSRKVA